MHDSGAAKPESVNQEYLADAQIQAQGIGWMTDEIRRMRAMLAEARLMLVKLGVKNRKVATRSSGSIAETHQLKAQRIFDLVSRIDTALGGVGVRTEKKARSASAEETREG